MPRYLTRGLQTALDVAALSAAFWASYLFRFEFSIPDDYLDSALRYWVAVVALQYAVLVLFRIPRFSWRYISLWETAGIAGAMLVSSLLLFVIRLAFVDQIGVLGMPFGVISSNFVLCSGALVAIRGIRRLHGESQERKRRENGTSRARVLLIGAGQAGLLVARELAARPNLGLQAVGFVDDNPLKIGTRIGGLTVLGNTDELTKIAQQKRATRALITIANASGRDIRRLAVLCRDAGLDAKIIPGIYEIVGDNVNLSRIRDVAIEDLLGREPVALDETQISSTINGTIVMVTGAGGSIGSELCRQVSRFGPRQLVLVERFENALFEIHRELRKQFPDITIEPRVADVTDRHRMTQIFEEHRPTIVLHAAAHKHVPMMESNPGEAIKNNIGGTKLIADLADQFGAQRFVLISTDKAVNPTSVMGATKRVAESYIQALGARSETVFVAVRFGNVLGSNGSVIPIFKEQIARGGPVTITHPDMRRYFMTIPEASQLVLQAGAMGEGGEIFILDMGESVKILDLARDLITLSGFRPEVDIPIEFSGIRPGEKLFEELSTDAEHASMTKHPKIYTGLSTAGQLEKLAREIEELMALCHLDPERIRGALSTMVPEYTVTAKADPKARKSDTGSRPLIAV